MAPRARACRLRVLKNNPDFNLARWLGMIPHREPWQTELLADLRDDLIAGRSPARIAVASGHGVGKSALVAWLVNRRCRSPMRIASLLPR